MKVELLESRKDMYRTLYLEKAKQYDELEEKARKLMTLTEEHLALDKERAQLNLERAGKRLRRAAVWGVIYAAILIAVFISDIVENERFDAVFYGILAVVLLSISVFALVTSQKPKNTTKDKEIKS